MLNSGGRPVKCCSVFLSSGFLWRTRDVAHLFSGAMVFQHYITPTNWHRLPSATIRVRWQTQNKHLLLLYSIFKNKCTGTASLLTGGLVNLRRSYRGIRIKFRLFHNQLKIPCSSFKNQRQLVPGRIKPPSVPSVLSNLTKKARDYKKSNKTSFICKWRSVPGAGGSNLLLHMRLLYPLFFAIFSHGLIIVKVGYFLFYLFFAQSRGRLRVGLQRSL